MNVIIEGLTQKNVQLEKIIKINNEQMTNMMDKINSLKNEIDINNNLINELKSELETKHSENNRLKGELETKHSENNRLKGELETKCLEIDNINNKLNLYDLKDKEYKKHIDKALQNNPNLELHGCFLVHK